ncbi:uncharacterized protein LOC128740130 [Sabethes cyaneus]|uniref:uncharacterized protein LOC128740130 n=1 Tax=Sabethes cyaneus TaxID=53552 RepID=UPI00237EDF05|nr:uncharacterized protein LOC128740130 [Sabethes cyaneus]
MWTCVGCDRSFHAACVGVPIQRGSLRKRDRKIDPQSYLLPCCSPCQALININFDIKSLTAEQAKLTELINNNTEVIHRTTQQNNVGAVHETIDRIESLLIEIKKELTGGKSAACTGNVISVKNHITSALDIAMRSCYENVEATLATMTTSISTDLKLINEEIKLISTNAAVFKDSAVAADMLYNWPATQIMGELQHLTEAVIRLETPQSAPAPSIAVELNNANCNDDSVDHSGWRIIGSTRRWYADWRDYDNKKKRREAQEQREFKAWRNRKNRRQRRMRTNNRGNTSVNNRNSNGVYNSNNSSRYNNNNRNINNNRGITAIFLSIIHNTITSAIIEIIFPRIEYYLRLLDITFLDHL